MKDLLRRRSTWAALLTALALFFGFSVTQEQRDALWSLLQGLLGAP